METEQLYPRLERVSIDTILDYAAKTDKPALKLILGRVVEQREPYDKWVNQYCDYKDCGLLW